LVTILELGQEFTASFTILRLCFYHLKLQDLSIICDRFTSLERIYLPVLRMSLSQIAACLAKLPHLRMVGLKFYAAHYFRRHQLQNDQAIPVVMVPGVAHLKLMPYFESHEDLDRLHLEDIFTCRPMGLRIECRQCTVCQFTSRNQDKEYAAKRLACEKLMNKKLDKRFE